MVSANIRGVYTYSVYSAGSCEPGNVLSTAKTIVCTELNIWETEQKITISKVSKKTSYRWFLTKVSIISPGKGISMYKNTRGQTYISFVSCIVRWILYHWATWETPTSINRRIISGFFHHCILQCLRYGKCSIGVSVIGWIWNHFLTIYSNCCPFRFKKSICRSVIPTMSFLIFSGNFHCNFLMSRLEYINYIYIYNYMLNLWA